MDNDGPFFKQQAFIDGQWCEADHGGTLTVLNPADQSLVGTIPNMGKKETERAIVAAQCALAAWQGLTAVERSDYLLKWCELLLKHKHALATLLTLEQGKPLKEAILEIDYGASYLRWFAEEGRRVYGDVIPAEKSHLRYLVLKQPIGVVAAITPWNFPNAMIARKCAPALAAGCTLVIKPSDLTPFSALALAGLAEQAGFPKGVINVVTGEAQAIGEALCQNPVVKKLSFTGSTPVGKYLYRQCADTVKKLSLELGGNAPVLVFDDVDIDQAVQQVMLSKFRNSGQTCVCANRILVHERIYEAFLQALVVKVQALSVDHGLADADIGPLINPAAIEKIERLVRDAVGRGAVLHCGGAVHAKGLQFYQPTVLSNADATMAIAHEEIFGPVAVLYRFRSEQEAIELANQVSVGLAAYCFTENHRRLWRVAEQLQYGIVGVNVGSFSAAVAPFGGVKESGLGREGSKYGIEDYLNIKYVCMEV